MNTLNPMALKRVYDYINYQYEWGYYDDTMLLDFEEDEAWVWNSCRKNFDYFCECVWNKFPHLGDAEIRRNDNGKYEIVFDLEK